MHADRRPVQADIPSRQAIRALPTVWVPPHRKSRLRLMKGAAVLRREKTAPRTDALQWVFQEYQPAPGWYLADVVKRECKFGG